MADTYLDYKATIWCRIPIYSDYALEEVKDALDKGISPIDLYDLGLEDNLGNCETLHDTEEFIYPEENGDQPTIEIYKDTEVIWDNINKE